MIIKGFWFEPHLSTRHEASIQLLDSHYVLTAEGSTGRTGSTREFKVSDRLGSMPRRLLWNDEAVFETADNEAIDQWLDRVSHDGSKSLFLHRLERSWTWAAVGALLTVVVVFSGFRWGLPAVASSVAHNLPASVHQSLSRETLATLDKFLFEPSEAPAAEQEEIQRRFDSMVKALPASDFAFTLHFRHMGGVANAMALPGGDIIVTDALLELVEHPDELDSVLLHEFGHVVERHGLQQVIQSSAITVIVALAFGDLSGIGELGIGLPAFLLQSSYSRGRESEADSFAFALMGELEKDPAHFASVITRLAGQGDETEEDGERKNDYFSSHPNAAERARRAMQASRELGF